ncbi:MAG: bifunctional oligoribonuclease/PAP phosphatase NrnA [Victivallales bacterium]|nr:bifunctional oligoribonuclease/PAP phosphatase NrnA [Victivallales bacterium]
MEKNKINPEKAAELLRKYNNFLIVTHENPDGDALGSSFALLLYLQLAGKNVQLLLPEQVPEKYTNFAPAGNLTYATGLDWANFDFMIYIDTPMPQRAALSELNFKNIPLPSLNIDHHPDNINYAQWNLVIPEAAAAAEIIFMILKADAELKITPEIASLLMLGIVMDTGAFRFDNSSPQVMRHAAELLELNADYHHIINEMFFSVPLSQIQFQAELISNHLRKACLGKLAWFFVPPALIEKYDVNMRNTEGLIESLRVICGTEIVVIMQEHKMGYKISMRSKNPKYSVGSIARKLNGGGHEMAAGGLIKTSTLKSAEKILITHAEGVFNAV